MRSDAAVLAGLGQVQRLIAGPAVQVRCLECIGFGTPPGPRDTADARTLLAWAGR